MNILMLNQDWFAAEFRAAGHHVVTCGNSKHLDHYLEFPLLHVDSVIEVAMKDRHPDIIIAHDNSAPIVLLGLDETPIPTLFYSVDAHHHVDLHKHLALLFDETLLAQPDYTSEFESLGYSPKWMPLWASEYVEPCEQKDFGAVFVGSLNRKLNPQRVDFFEALKKKAPIDVRSGGFRDFFSRAQVVVNQTVKLDLNFRVFEAMMCGACLLTERTRNGLFDLFEDGVHIVTYEHGNVDEAAAKISELLANPARCSEIGARGRKEILGKHTTMHRAQWLLEMLPKIKKRQSAMRFYASMVNLATLGARLEAIDTTLSGTAYIQALKSAEHALAHNEALTEEAACYLVIACSRYGARLRTSAADALLSQTMLRHPGNATVKLAQIRSLLNRGEKAEATRLAQELAPGPTEITFAKSEEFIADLIFKVVEATNANM